MWKRKSPIWPSSPNPSAPAWLPAATTSKPAPATQPARSHSQAWQPTRAPAWVRPRDGSQVGAAVRPGGGGGDRWRLVGVAGVAGATRDLVDRGWGDRARGVRVRGDLPTRPEL